MLHARRRIDVLNKLKTQVCYYINYQDKIYNFVDLRKEKSINCLTVKEYKDKQIFCR